MSYPAGHLLYSGVAQNSKRRFHEQRSSRRTTRASGDVSRLTPEWPDHRGLLGRATPRCLPGSVRCPRTVDCWCVLQDLAPTNAGGRRLGQFQVAGHPGRLGQPQAIGLRACSSSMYMTDTHRVNRVPVTTVSVSLLTLHSLTPQPSIICAALQALYPAVATVDGVCLFACVEAERAVISCHHRLTHDLAVVADHWWLMTVCLPENQLCIPIQRVIHGTKTQHRRNGSQPYLIDYFLSKSRQSFQKCRRISILNFLRITLLEGQRRTVARNKQRQPITSSAYTKEA